MKIALFLLLATICLPAVAQTDASSPLPEGLSFVAPAYPRLASDGRIQGTTVTRIRVGKDGKVMEAAVVSGHRIFTKYVVAALKQWRFAPSQEEHEFDVTCRFEFYSDRECLKADGQPATPETIVSVKLPTQVLVQTTEKCWSTTVTTSDPIEH